MITKGNMLRPFNKFSQLTFYEVYRNIDVENLSVDIAA